MTDAFPREKLGLAMGTNTMVAAVGLVIGPVLGGWLVRFGWGGVFWFNVPLGAIGTAWAALVLPAAVLTGFAFAAAGMAATTFMRSWRDFEDVMLVSMPLFLFSTTFYPLGVYPRPLQLVVECTPLYQAVWLMRDLSLGTVTPALLLPALYLAVMGVSGLAVAARRVSRLLLR